MCPGHSGYVKALLAGPSSIAALTFGVHAEQTSVPTKQVTMYIYGDFSKKVEHPRKRPALQYSESLPPEVIEEAKRNPHFQIINTRSLSVFVADDLQPGWVRIDPDLR